MGRVALPCVCGHGLTPMSYDIPVSEKDGFVVVKCGACNMIRTSERDEHYEKLYTEGERYHVAEMDKIGREHYTERFGHDFDLANNARIPAHLRQLRTLDVGCANGAFVHAMAVLGFDAEGLELNPSMAEFAANESGCRVHQSWDTVMGAYDVITYHDVFEHVVDPREELERIRDHLCADGLLVLDCPDADEVFGPDARAPHHEKPDQHLWYFTERSLSSLLASHQFIVTFVDRPIVGKIVVYARKNGA